MKRFFLTAALVLGAGAAAADPIEGMWKTQVDDGAYAQVLIKPCGPAFCGTIAKAFKGGAPYASPNIGKMIVIDMAPQGNGKYAGKVWRPSNDKTYSGKVNLAGDSMALAGCVAGGLFCKSQTWTRVK